eukprot:scaffold119246_cov48-Phaeocystis_antarctica.AAC.1
MEGDADDGLDEAVERQLGALGDAVEDGTQAGVAHVRGDATVHHQQQPLVHAEGRVGRISDGGSTATALVPRPHVYGVLDGVVREDPSKLGEAISQQLVHLVGPQREAGQRLEPAVVR